MKEKNSRESLRSSPDKTKKAIEVRLHCYKLTHEILLREQEHSPRNMR